MIAHRWLMVVVAFVVCCSRIVAQHPETAPPLCPNLLLLLLADDLRADVLAEFHRPDG